jgi:2-amino-4-hydroxy-6-hydroxymethyldihydropteridine diphosphokinase
LDKAGMAIQEEVGKLIKSSSRYQTAAWGKTDQPDFINQVLKLETSLRPLEVLKTILGIERKLGRERTEKWGSRTIDIDILFYDQEVVASSELTIPHPYLQQRAFTLIPLAELEPDFVHPVFKKTVSELLDELESQLEVKKL